VTAQVSRQAAAPPSLDIEREERVELRSVGVDIGSATSHMVFSRIVVEKVGVRYVTVERTTLYESPIILTPYDGPLLIDAASLSRFVDAQFDAAGLQRDDVDTGALILTGVALLRSNSRAIADVFAREAGKMVAVSAGDNMEGVLAAHGSGAIAASSSRPGDLIHVDIGGGTTKIVLCRDGSVIAQAAVDIGARLVATDDRGLISRIEQAGAHLGQAAGQRLELGHALPDAGKAAIAGYLADELFRIVRITGDGRSPLLRGAPLPAFEPAWVSFSGGVSEYLYGREESSYGDLGPFIADAIRSRLTCSGVTLAGHAGPGIRATVLGASQYTVQLSGSTIYVSDANILPLRNVPVVVPPFSMTGLEARSVAQVLRETLAQHDLSDSGQPVAVAYHWEGLATYDRLHEFCQGLAAGLGNAAAGGCPLVLISADDVGGVLGTHLVREDLVRCPVVSVDCVEISTLDFVDIGEHLPGAASVPVVIKSLVFP
jgi:ethanolamine utilization protein EutA